MRVISPPGTYHRNDPHLERTRIVSEVFDLDALAAEQHQEPFEFRFGGEIFTLPAVLDLRLAGTFAEGGNSRPDQMLAALLGEEQWARMCLNPAPLSVQMTEALLDRWSKHLGIDPGKSPVSTDS